MREFLAIDDDSYVVHVEIEKSVLQKMMTAFLEEE